MNPKNRPVMSVLKLLGLATVLALHCQAIIAADMVIPNLSVNGWLPHTMGNGVGVPGGLERFRPGGANARTATINVIDFGADASGAVDSKANAESALGEVGDEEVLYFPEGIYIISSALNVGNKSNFTLRGAGSGVKSTSTHIVGTGTKSFTIPAGGGWQVGCGVRAWKRNDDRVWMQGVCTGYIGNTLTVNFTSTSGDTDTLSDWIVSQTLFIVGDRLANYGNVTFPLTDYVNVVNSPMAGDSEIELSDASSYAADDIVFIQSLTTSEMYSVGGTKYLRPIVNRVVSKAGNTITLAVPIQFSLPSSLSPIITRDGNHSEYVGMEDFMVVASGNEETVLGGPIMKMTRTFGSWWYNVHVAMTTQFQSSITESVRCEVAYCRSMWRVPSPDGAGGAAIEIGAVNACLFRHNIFGQSLPATEVNAGVVGTAFLYNLGVKQNLNTNHNPHNSYNLYEGNIASFAQSDGYYGGASHETFFRNYFHGSQDEGGNPVGTGWIVWNRFYRYGNAVGNVLGTSGSSDGLMSMGYPYMGGGASSGTSNSVLGLLATHVDGDGNSRMIGTVTTRTSGTDCVITLTSGNKSAFENPLMLNGETGPHSVTWGAPSIFFGTRLHYNMTFDGSGSGATTIHLTGGGGDDIPTVGTDVSIYTGPLGYSEQDNAVEETAFLKGNYLSDAAGGGSIDIPLGSDTLPSSLAYTSTPFDWPMSLTYPPVNPSSPPGYNREIIPAGYFYVNGSWPYGGTSPGDATVTGTTTVTNTLTLP